jgi:hypothetical protein
MIWLLLKVLISNKLIVCEKLEETRTPILNKIIQEVSSIFAEQKLGGKIDLLQIIINPFAYAAGEIFT